jgi:4'-phosphopantetheinyl transferase
MRIDIHPFDLDGRRDDLNHARAALSADERARADRFVDATIARRFILCRWKVRRVLAEITGKPAHRIEFAESPLGKPSLAEGALHFNVSHSDTMGVLATGPVALGIDVERIKPIEMMVAERFFSQAENAALARLPIAEQHRGILRCWTRKEAILKALGVGLSVPLSAFSVSTTSHTPHLESCDFDLDAVQKLRLCDLALGPDWIGAVCGETWGANLELRYQPML